MVEPAPQVTEVTAAQEPEQVTVVMAAPVTAQVTAAQVAVPAMAPGTVRAMEVAMAAGLNEFRGMQNEYDGPERQCACVDHSTTNAIENLTFESMKKVYGRIVTRDNPVPWGRCQICKGTGIDRRP